MLKVTDRAVEEFKKFLVESDMEDFAIRIYLAESSCCCGGHYHLKIVEEGEEGDVLVEQKGLKLFLDPIAYEKLSEATIDYDEGFIIETR